MSKPLQAAIGAAAIAFVLWAVYSVQPNSQGAGDEQYQGEFQARPAQELIDRKEGVSQATSGQVPASAGQEQLKENTKAVPAKRSKDKNVTELR